MTARGALRLQGSDVALVRRSAGAVVVVYLDRHGRPTPHTRTCWPHDLIGNGWHLAAIKAAIQALPSDGSAPAVRTSRSEVREAPKAFLFAHHVADHQRED